MTTKLRAAIYTRFSTAQQREASTEDQARNCRKRITAEGWRLAQHFKDEALSGSLTARPGYQSLLKAAERKEFDVLVVDDLSRLSRDQVESERTIRRLEFGGVRIVGVGDGYDSQSKSRKVQRGVRGLMNEMYIDDLKDKVHRGLTGQALKHYWCGGKVFGYRLVQEKDATRTDPHGNPLVVGTRMEVDPAQAAVVRRVFTLYADGQSWRGVAAKLNAEGVPSPGSYWRGRSVRRATGWAQSCVRLMLRNPLYTGHVRWNTSQWLKDPDTGRRQRRERPESEWHQRQDESLRIIDARLWDRVANRTRLSADGDERLKSGGKAAYIMSGLMVCGHCGRNYVMDSATHYRCGGWSDGKACTNSSRVRRDRAQDILLEPIRRSLLDPARVAREAKWLESEFAKRLSRSDDQPQALRELDARLARLRAGVADLEPDELYPSGHPTLDGQSISASSVG